MEDTGKGSWARDKDSLKKFLKLYCAKKLSTILVKIQILIQNLGWGLEFCISKF